MRLWSLHPKYLDAAGLVAVWREGLLAQKVLAGQTKGYKRHPQLIRFSDYADSAWAIDAYLSGIMDEAVKRGYGFDSTKINRYESVGIIEIPEGQLDYEFKHLMRKLAVRDIERYEKLKQIERVEPHPLFRVVGGGVCSWEVVSDESSD